MGGPLRPAPYITVPQSKMTDGSSEGDNFLQGRARRMFGEWVGI